MSTVIPRDAGASGKPSYGTVFDRTRMLGYLTAADDFQFVTEPPRDMKGGDIILHISCLVHSIAHIPYLAQKIMERLGLDFTTLGGPENCCGSLHWHRGDEELGLQTASIALATFQRLKPVRVLSLCPDCDTSFARRKGRQHTFEHINISQIFSENLDKLKSLMQRPVNRRVVIHEHLDNDNRQRDAQNIRRVLRAVPGLEVIDAPAASSGSRPCSLPMFPLSDEDTRAMFEEANRLGASDLIVPYHSCYRQHCKAQLTYGIEVQHYLSIVAESIGLPYEEPFKRLRMLDDVDAAMSLLRPRITKLGYDEETVRSYVEASIYV